MDLKDIKDKKGSNGSNGSKNKDFCKNVEKEMMVKCWDIHFDYDRKKCDLLTKLMLECICQKVKYLPKD